LSIDWTITHALNGTLRGHEWLEDPMTFLVNVSIPLIAVPLIALWFLAKPYERSTWRLATASALASSAFALLVNQLASKLWDRPRPFVDHATSLTLFASHSTDASFPSDHASAAFAIAVAVLLFHRRTGLAFLALAAAISVARVFEGVHYPTDILAGAAIGTVSAILVTRLARRAIDPVVAVAQRVTDPVVALVRR
jgi:undecaprenyl-diphosphatase